MISGVDDCFDVCVIGAGPGGCTAATFIAMAGHKVLLLEKESLPIHKIGESLLPATIHGICPLLGVSEEIARQKFIKKHGGTFRWGKNKEPWTFAFAESSRFPGPTSYAYQVERIKFDSILLNNAKRKGVEVREQNRVKVLLFEGDRVTGLVVSDSQGIEKKVDCRYVVDASGHASTLSRCVSERSYSDFFRNIAVFGYFDYGGRLPEPNAGNIFTVAFERGWFWYIPLSDKLTSVGAVIGQEYSSVLRQPVEIALDMLIAECAPIKTLLSNATRCSIAPYNETRVRKDYSYCHSRFSRSGLVLVGDAACFIDPIFSSGVHLATYSALLAARSINTCLKGEISESLCFAEFEARYRREYDLFYQFLTAFYDLDQDLDSYYWSARKLLPSAGSDRQAFVNLVGGGGSGDLMGVGTAVAPQSAPLGRHLFRAATGDSQDMYLESDGRSLEGRKMWQELTSEGTRLQLRGMLRELTPPESPLFGNSIIPTADGLHWTNRATS